MAPWSTVDIKAAETLGELLSAKRDDTLGTSDEIEQYDVAKAIGFSQSYVSRIESGHVEHIVPKWPSKRQLALLQAYRFSSEEIQEIAEKFSLDIPSVKNFTSDPVQTLDKLPRQTITGVGAGGFREVNVSDFVAAGRRLEDVIQVHAKDGIFVARDVPIPEGSFVYIDRTQKPEQGKNALYKVRGHDRFILLKYSEVVPEQFVTSYDSKSFMELKANDPELELLGIVFGVLALDAKD